MTYYDDLAVQFRNNLRIQQRGLPVLSSCHELRAIHTKNRNEHR